MKEALKDGLRQIHIPLMILAIGVLLITQSFCVDPKMTEPTADAETLLKYR